MRAGLISLMLAVLSGCASVATLNPSVTLASPQQWLLEHRPAQGALQAWLLVVQNQAQGSLWALYDPLGVPRERLLWQSGQWQRQGLLPPFTLTDSRELFAALQFALTPAEQVVKAFPTARSTAQQRCLPTPRTTKCHWQVSYPEGTLAPAQITLSNGLQLTLQPITRTEAQP